MELDHIFMCVTPDAPEAEHLTALGFTEGTPNQHPGQGTACRRFFFHNGFLELLYLSNSQEAQSQLTGPTGLYERFTSQASPIGLCFRPDRADGSDAPFAHWHYQPAYLPPHIKVDIAQAPFSEPMWFFLGIASRPDQAPAERRQPLEHANGIQNISAVRLTHPFEGNHSDAARQAAALNDFELIEGDEALLEIEFDQAKQGQCHDLRPELPLILRW